MLDAMINSPFFGLTLSAVAWCFGRWLQQRTGLILLNHMLVAVVFVILFLNMTGITYEQYSIGGDFIKMLLGPVTAVLALNIYNQRKVLGEYFMPVLVGCFVGSLVSLVSILGLCALFGIEESLTASIMPKSCTTAIAIGIADNIIDNCDGKDNKSVIKCLIGISVFTTDTRAKYNEDGTITLYDTVEIQSVTETSLAYGVLKAGDILHKIKLADQDEYTICRQFEMIDLLLNARVGDTVTITVLRNGEEVSFTGTFTEESISVVS